MLAKGRSSYMGWRRHDDRWKSPLCEQAVVNLDQPAWTGRTVFKIQPRYLAEASEHFYQLSDGLNSYSGQDGNKKRKGPVEEKNLNLDDRLAFMQARRLELSSFFQNAVWSFDNESSASPDRILRARFVLKWAKHPDGSPRAKARLQGLTTLTPSPEVWPAHHPP